jgi:hypothetical protein
VPLEPPVERSTDADGTRARTSSLSVRGASASESGMITITSAPAGGGADCATTRAASAAPQNAMSDARASSIREEISIIGGSLDGR